MTAHTKGPWAVDVESRDGGGSYERIITPDKAFSVNGGRIAATSAWWYDRDTADANAARIVACVNACEGVADPEAVRELIEAARKCCASHYPPRADFMGELHTALARLEGGK